MRATKKYFYIIIEPAPNLNKPKISFSAFLLNSKHFEFQISSNHCKFLDFLQKRFFHWKSFHNEFFREWGCGPCRVRASVDALAPHSLKKFVMKRFSMKNVFVKSQGIYLESSWFEIQNVSNSAKKQKNKFWFCSNWEQFQL